MFNNIKTQKITFRQNVKYKYNNFYSKIKIMKITMK